ncbi:excalibur calcium-binding domain-containing protein [Nocardia blacklockiae]|uniref:excalibur calcium-binding domain-containing protein n=1 Tax=Nocardia blacklockiae TaxID=480036 RepID=UPI001E646DA4|nr:excalibur calcium-binding domain-containing protein [Nocardia blacklockiae]
MYVDHTVASRTLATAAVLLTLGIAAAPAAFAAPRDGGALPPGSSGAAPSAGGSGWSNDPRETVLLPPAPEEDGGYPFYVNCAQVRAEHKGPLYAGQPGYRPQLDPDNDGVAC